MNEITFSLGILILFLLWIDRGNTIQYTAVLFQTIFQDVYTLHIEKYMFMPDTGHWYKVSMYKKTGIGQFK